MIVRQLEGGVLVGYPAMHDPLARFFVQTVFIIAICRGLALATYCMKQPNVIFEIIGGILLGPSAIGRDKYYLHSLFPSSSLANLNLVANIGLVLYLFLVGLELDPKLLRSHFRNAAGISLCGIAVPFSVGIGISRVMFDILQKDDPSVTNVSFTSFFVFIGTAMSITAFPVLARILKEGGLIYTKCGALAMGAAAIDDATAWCLLTLAISIANADSMHTAGYVFLYVVIFAVGLFLVIRPLFHLLVANVEAVNNKFLSSTLFAFTLCMLFMCSWVTALVGVHFIFGAFLFGLVVPHGSMLHRDCNEWIEQLVVTFMLPLYFALSGLKTDVTTLHTAEEGLVLLLVIAVACAGKFFGTSIPAYIGGMTVREAAVIGTLMNTRGLVELIVLNLGLSSGILNIRTFSVMVIMALFTTFITTPIVDLLYPPITRVRAGSKLDELHGAAEEPTAQDVDAALLVLEMKRFSKEIRLALVVDRLEDLEQSTKLLTLFAPSGADDELSVTAIHFIEPSHTADDEFLGLNERGRIVRVDEESTDVAKALRDMEDPAAKRPELLPLSLFCKASDAGINAFRIQGSPDEFQTELRRLARFNGCCMVLMHWRAESVYFQKLFWASAQELSLPIALLVHKPAFPTAPDSEQQVRKRRSTKALFALPTSDGEDEEVLYSSLDPQAVPRGRRSGVSNSLTKVRRVAKQQMTVVAALTGRQMDVVILPMLLRFASKPMTSISLLLPRNADAFEPLVRNALNCFRKEVAELGNVVIEELECAADDMDALHIAVSRSRFDLLLMSFVEPNDGVSLSSQSARAPSFSQISSAGMPPASQSWRETLSGNAASSLDEEIVRRTMGMPPQYVGTALAYPEMGRLGCLVYQSVQNKACSMLIIHASRRMAATRRGSGNEMLSAASSAVDIEMGSRTAEAPNRPVETKEKENF